MSTLSRLLGGALAAAAVSGALTLTAGTAHAQVIDTDYIKINGGHADVGRGPHEFGSPKFPGILTWDVNPSGVTARLLSAVYWDAAFSGGCARAQMRVYDQQNRRIDTRVSGAACRAGDVFGGQVPTVAFNPSVTSKTAHHVVVVTQEAPGPHGPWKTTGSQRANFGQPGGSD